MASTTRRITRGIKLLGRAWRNWRPKFWHVVAVGTAGLIVSIFRHANSQDFTAITDALESANTEVRSGVFPAVSAILGAIVLIAIAAGVVHVITRGK